MDQVSSLLRSRGRRRASTLLVLWGLTAAACAADAKLRQESCGVDGGCSTTMDAGAPMLDAAPSIALEVDASGQYKCGSWKAARFDDRGPPPEAHPYGVEQNSMGTFSEYVCRFRDVLDGRPIVLQGKAVFGFSCYAVLPASSTTPAQVQPSETFEVLVESKACAQMVPFEPSLRLLPTGVDADGDPTFTCRGVVKASGVPGMSMTLGRYDPARNSCVFEWHNNVREAPRLEGEQFEVLAVTSAGGEP